MIFLVAGVLPSAELAGVMHGGPCRELMCGEDGGNGGEKVREGESAMD